jgi:hypothetical protein
LKSLAPFLFQRFEYSAAAGSGSQGQGVSSYLCFSMMLLLAGLARKIGCQGDDWLPLLYIEGLAQSPGVIGCICHRAVHPCIRTYKLPAAFLPVFSRVTS